ncbi:GNAT family N-acetyltransferase [soil metagenome]
MRSERVGTHAVSTISAGSFGFEAKAGELHIPHIGEISLVTTLAGLEALAAPWRALARSAVRPAGLFQSYDWCAAWSRIYAAPGSCNELCVLTGYDQGELVFVWPLMKTRLGPLRVLRWLSEPFAQYGDILVSPATDAAAWLQAGVDFLKRLKDIDSIRLRHVRRDSLAYPYLAGKFQAAGEADGAPYLDLTPFPTEDAYEKRYSKEQRKRRRKIRKYLESKGTVTFEVLRAGSVMDRAMDQALAEKRKWLASRGLYSRPISCTAIENFLRELSRAPGEEPAVVTSRLTAGGTPISWEIGLRYGDTHFGFITAHDTALTDASPARLHMDLSQRQAIKDGMKTFDLMVPADPHKESWSNGTVEVLDFHTPLSFQGWLYGFVYLQNLRPLIRRAYYSAAPRIRRYFVQASL